MILVHYCASVPGRDNVPFRHAFGKDAIPTIHRRRPVGAGGRRSHARAARLDIVCYPYIHSLECPIMAGVAVVAIMGAVFMAVLVVLTLMRTSGYRAESDGRERYCGFANHKLGRETRGGFLMLADDRLRFIPHHVNVHCTDYSVCLSDIERVGYFNGYGIIPNGLAIRLHNGEEVRFIVFRRSLWRKHIEAVASAYVCDKRGVRL